MRDHLVFLLNGKETVVNHADPRTTLLEFLRSDHGPHLTGAKLGCGEGGCGACTVLVSREENGTVRHRSVNACLAPLCAVDGCHVTTVEGIGSASDPHPVQERMAKLHGSQCGFCTPGIVMALYSKLQENPRPTLHDIEEAFDGNLCRCTGYRPILDAAKTFTVPDSCRSCANASHCLANGMNAEAVMTSTDTKLKNPRPEEAWTVGYDPEQPKHKPPQVPHSIAVRAHESLRIAGPTVTWYRPATLHELLRVTQTHHNFKIITGNTEVGIETKIRGLQYPVLVSASSVAEMTALRDGTEEGATFVDIGASCTLSQLSEKLSELQTGASTVFASLTRMLRWFASTPIRNAACLGGNLCTASPIGDLAPMLIASRAELTAAKLLEDGTVATRIIPMTGFIKGYRKTALEHGEVLVSVRIFDTRPSTTEGKRFVANAYKQSRRRDDDISIVTGAFTAEATVPADGKGKATIAHAAAAYGGIAPWTVAVDKVAEALVGLQLPLGPEGYASADKKIAAAVKEAVKLAPNVPGGMPAFRMTLVASMALRFLADVERAVLGKAATADDGDLADSYMSREAPISSGVQRYPRDPLGGHLTAAAFEKAVVMSDLKPIKNESRGAMGEALAHKSGLLHTTGQAQYVDDIATAPGTLHAALVLSDRPVGRFELARLDVVREMPGVRAIVTADDVPGNRNIIGVAPPLDEELFRVSSVTCAGQLLCVVVGDTAVAAATGARAVQVLWADKSDDDVEPVISIAQAIEKKKYHAVQHSIVSGNVETALKQEDLVVVKGTVRMNGPEHFYLECAGAIAIPREQDEMEVIASTQALNPAHVAVARACGLPMHKIVCRTKRIGGAFGGKESRVTWICAVAAVAARKTNKPVRLMLDRYTDMLTQGTRHPFRGDYTIAATKDGKLVVYDVDLYSNAGYSTDLSIGVMDRALFHTTNAYFVPNTAARGHICMTNTVTTTAFRGFGGPQGMLVIESAIEDLARKLGVPADAIREKNLIVDGQKAPYGMTHANNHTPRMWQTLQSPEHADVQRRQAAIDLFNKEHKYRKRGIAQLPTIYGVSFNVLHLNQGGCTVLVYTDGTVRVSHGGVEMGQGIHTKVCQVVAGALGISFDRVFVAESSTDQLPNATPSAASASFDMYGNAALDACEQLQQRLAPFQPAKAMEDMDGDARFQHAVAAAYFAQVDLCAHGFFRSYACYDFNKPVGERGCPFQYCTNGVASSEVEIDVMNGDMRVLRTDIVMDLGVSPNPAVDIGQIEGAYVQGMGYYTLEETVWGGDEHTWLKPGICLTRGPGAYKLPSFNDVPVDMRVTLLDKAPNPKAVHSSKAVGEPPLFLSASVVFAVRNAVIAARREHMDGAAADALPPLDVPLTAERIRMACGDATAQTFLDEVVSKGGKAQPALFC
jgi:xanthine dehydrogenase/oxidase